jgi:Tfp pilus assembly protein FimT
MTTDPVIHMTTRRQLRGITLVELMTTMSVAAIALTVGIPSLTAVSASMHRSQANMELMSAGTLARSEAGRRGHPVTLCASPDGLGCSTEPAPDWHTGWIVFIDEDADGEIDQETDRILYTTAFEGDAFSLTFSGSTPGHITFRGSGFPVANGTFSYCDRDTSRTLTLTHVGRIEQTASGDGCP